MAIDVVPFLGWYFLPGFVAGILQSVYYGITIRAGDPKPQPGTPRYAAHRRRILMLVIIAYLLYTIYETDYQLRAAGNFYQDLGVSFDVDEKALERRFRRISATLHPDKITSASELPIAQARYVHLKNARDTLADPAKRFAYDRLGPEMLEWQKCKTVRDFVTTALNPQGHMAGYIALSFFMLVGNILGYLRTGLYWRYLTVAAVLVLELHTLIRPTHPRFLVSVMNPLLTALHLRTPYLPFQILSLARKLALTSFIALQQLMPLLSASPQGGTAANGEIQGAQLDRLGALAQMTNLEASRLLELDVTPFRMADSRSDGAGMKELRDSAKEWLVENAVRSQPAVREAVARAVQRRRLGGVDAGVGS
ncbi:hypothetical protein LTR28_008770 [Elasticomyces elasticus]|nr:hypothetical protein LTR28_008770 [Elasticomyces elasticus]